MTIATSFCCAGARRGRLLGSARWSAGYSGGRNENSQGWRIHFCYVDSCFFLLQRLRARKQEPSADSFYAEIGKAPEKARAKQNAFEKDPDAVAAGRILFEQRCAE